jgi:hypothetical protein
MRPTQAALFLSIFLVVLTQTTLQQNVYNCQISQLTNFSSQPELKKNSSKLQLDISSNHTIFFYAKIPKAAKAETQKDKVVYTMGLIKNKKGALIYRIDLEKTTDAFNKLAYDLILYHKSKTKEKLSKTIIQRGHHPENWFFIQ